MADFSQFISGLLQHEGGFTNNSLDRGGATNKGVTISTFQQYALSILGIQPTLDNLKALTDQQAGQIYKAQYWDKVSGDAINDQSTAEIMVDMAINSGPGAAGSLAQRVLNDMGVVGITIDGVVGPMTVKAINNADTADFYNRYKQGRIDFYNQIVANDPSQKVFLQGWLNRINDFPDMGTDSTT